MRFFLRGEGEIEAIEFRKKRKFQTRKGGLIIKTPPTELNDHWFKKKPFKPEISRSLKKIGE